MCTCRCVCVHVCACMGVCVHVHVCMVVCARARVHGCVCTCTCACVCHKSLLCHSLPYSFEVLNEPFMYVHFIELEAK